MTKKEPSWIDQNKSTIVAVLSVLGVTSVGSGLKFVNEIYTDVENIRNYIQ